MLGGGERTHEPDAEDFSREWPEAAGDLDTVIVEQRGANLCVVDSLRAPRTVFRFQMRWSFAEPACLIPCASISLYELPDAPRDAARSDSAKPFFFDQRQAFVQGIEHCCRCGVVIAMRLQQVVGDQPDIEVPGSGCGVVRFFSSSAARGETVIGDSPGGQLSPFCVQL